MQASASSTAPSFRLQLDRLRERFAGRPPRTRFAPSPTGYLHEGHVLNALFTWALARELGGTVVLRMEDHDRQRSKPAYETAILCVPPERSPRAL